MFNFFDMMDLSLKNIHHVLNTLGPCDATKNWVNLGSGNGMLPDGTKPLPEPMSTYHQ